MNFANEIFRFYDSSEKKLQLFKGNESFQGSIWKLEKMSYIAE